MADMLCAVFRGTHTSQEEHRLHRFKVAHLIFADPPLLQNLVPLIFASMLSFLIAYRFLTSIIGYLKIQC